MCFKRFLALAAVAGLALAASAKAADNYLDGAFKGRGMVPPSWANSGSTYSYRTVTPTRSFSYEPQAAAQPVPGAKGQASSDATKAATKVPATKPQGAVAQNNVQNTRSFSYDPSTTNRGVMTRSAARTPSYLVPKSDPRKYSP